MPHITLDPDTCVSNIEFEIGEYSPMFLTDLPDYMGETTVTPSMETQTLETANKAVHDNVVVEAIPYDEVEAATPVITVDGQGKVTATTNQQGGIVESSTKSAEYEQPTVEQATPDISVASDGVITATATQTGGFVAGGSKTATLAQETVEQATPTISVDNAGKITASATQAAGFVAAGTKSAELQQQTVEQATPSISVANDGTITATAEQQAGYVEAGIKQAQMSLPTATAATIIPSTASQQAIGASVFALGSIGVAPIPSEYIIPSGTSEITQNGTFDVTQYSAASVNVPIPPQPTGTLSISENGAYNVASYASAMVNVAGGGGISIDDLASIGVSGDIFITTNTIRAYAFCSQEIISRVEAPNVSLINNGAFMYCSGLTTASFLAAYSVYRSAFYACTELITANFPSAIYFGRQAFQYCHKLVELRLDSVNSVPRLEASVFADTPIGGYSASAGQFGSVFVPASLYQSFLTASYWSSIASRIVSV
jgi:hypothetical protein